MHETHLKISAGGEHTRALDRLDVVADDVGFSDNGGMKVGLVGRDDGMRFGERQETGVRSVPKSLDCVSYTDTQQRHTRDFVLIRFVYYKARMHVSLKPLT